MKRLALGLLLLFPSVAFAFDPTIPTPRVAVLRQESSVAATVSRYLREELDERGLDAFAVDLTYDEAVEQNYAEADYFVEIADTDAETGDFGGIGIGGRHGGVGLSVLSARVAAVVRIYDGRTFELIASENLLGKSRALLPTSASVGGRIFWLSLGLPIAQSVQMRNVARAAAREAASRVVSTLAAP